MEPTEDDEMRRFAAGEVQCVLDGEATVEPPVCWFGQNAIDGLTELGVKHE